MEGLVFEARSDDATYGVPSQTAEAFDAEYQQLVAEQSWKHPEKFGHIPSTFESHLAMMAKRSEALGIVTEYSEELLNMREELAALQGKMMSYDEYYQIVCACPEAFGIEASSVDSLFSNANAHGWHPGHDEHSKHESGDTAENKTKHKGKKKKRLSGLALLGITQKKPAT